MAGNLSLSEATQFLEGVLQMHSPMDSLARDRVSFLRDLIAAFMSKIPFQSVTAIATPKPERRGLTFQEIKVEMTTRRGGLCFEINYFTKVLLERLGFEVYHIGCTFMGKPNNHLSTVVKNLSRPGDLHLVDVGCGHPVFEPIPMDFDKESPLYKASYLVHKFVKDADGSFRWMHKSLQDYDGPPRSVVHDWYTFLEFKLEFRDIEFFAPHMENIHTVESGPEALSQFLVKLKAVVFRNGKLFAITGTSNVEEDASGKVNKKRSSSPQELAEVYKVHFPQFSAETVQRAIQTVTLKFEK
ncbi:uncharacterized protein LOC119725314 [Patiria miniata]|uniref:arylamine N-acetyltransferase n=1 Tax=Patiria miniata TaxID=46514 RepID=A0A913ZLG7_PATMI|nr:uncharacterized protein LOC119725314 [Patiria miniata]XP_038052623.1 uncharacterized protein LOC119725314 [Patiria miniata]XP_038052624.1 uncharacterized protein LOC119725314 [Patiria miniata]